MKISNKFSGTDGVINTNETHIPLTFLRSLFLTFFKILAKKKWNSYSLMEGVSYLKILRDIVLNVKWRENVILYIDVK